MQPRLLTAIILAHVALAGSAASGQHTPVYGGPTYDSQTGDGYSNPWASMGVNNAGQAVGTVTKSVKGTSQGARAVRFDSTGWTELPSLAGATSTYVNAINSSGIAVGTATANGDKAVCWDNNGAVAQLPAPVSITTRASAINNSGQVTGSGSGATRWEPNGGMTQLASVAADGCVYKSYNGGVAINASGQVCGRATKSVSGVKQGDVAVRWSSSGQITELETPPLFAADYLGIITGANALNDSGQVVGYGNRDRLKGTRAIRWEADGTATELNSLGVSSIGITNSSATAINAAGQAIGTATKYDGSYNGKGQRAVRWESNGAITELQNLGTDASNYTESTSYSINSKGEVAGKARFYRAGVYVEEHAVMWEEDGSVVDLNSLVDSSTGWLLKCAYSLSDTGWITGVGKFDPDLAGPIQPYDRLFLIHVPEPGSLALLTFGAIAVLRPRR